MAFREFLDAGIPAGEIAFFAQRLFRLLTACEERRTSGRAILDAALDVEAGCAPLGHGKLARSIKLWSEGQGRRSHRQAARFGAKLLEERPGLGIGLRIDLPVQMLAQLPIRQ